MIEKIPPSLVSASPKPRHALRSQPPTVRAYVAAVIVAGAALVAFSVTRSMTVDLATFLGLLSISVLTAAIKMSLPLAIGESSLSFSYVANFVSVVLLGTWPTVVIGAVTAWSQCTFRMRTRNPVYQTLFSMATLALSAAGAGVAYQLAQPLLVHPWWVQIGAAGAAASVYFLINTGLVSVAISLTSREPVRPTWKKNFLWSAPSYVLGAGLAMVVVEVSRDSSRWWVMIFSLPLYLTYRSLLAYSDRLVDEQRQVRELANVQQATIEALAQAIGAKDRTSPQHLRRMQACSEGLARAIGLPEAETRGIKTAAMLHDIGNLAVPEHILSKTGPLSDVEYERLKTHPKVGAEIVKSVPFPYPVASLILSHHERWDGRGYPACLKGEEIPAGARILAVADCFAAMLSVRAHRPARTYAEAIATLRENGGSALDPTLVERFIEILPEVENQLYVASRTAEANSTGLKTAGTDQALTDIARAHLEEQMLLDISQALSTSLRVSDVVALLSSSMVQFVPFVSCALFLLDEESQLFLCRHVVGPQHDEIRTIAATAVGSLAEILPAQPIQGLVRGAPATRIQSVLVSPLQTEGRTIGALALYHSDRDGFTADHHRLLRLISAQAAAVIANALVFERTHEQSLTDVLTELPNRRSFEHQFRQELARVERQQGPLSLLVLDMDRFKHVNDEFGHPAGDRALKEVAQVLRTSLRVYDVCARFAGDEFVVVLGDCDRIQAERRQHELRSAIAEVPFEPVPGQTVHLSASIGVASFPEDGRTADEMMAVADRRMYADKASRKSVSVSGQDTSPGHLWP